MTPATTVSTTARVGTRLSYGEGAPTWLERTTSAWVLTGESQVSVKRTTRPCGVPDEFGHGDLVVLVAAVVEHDQDVPAAHRGEVRGAFDRAVGQEADLVAQLHQVQAEVLGQQVGETSAREGDVALRVGQELDGAFQVVRRNLGEGAVHRGGEHLTAAAQ